ncbi:hypothetical protein Tco_0973435 [Tanacetum coccineum]
MLDEELAFKLQAEEEEEERLAKEKDQQIEEVNITWDDVQARVEADYQLAQRLQAQEQEELTDEEKARLFVQFLEQRRKHFAAKRVEEKRNRPPTRAQQRSFMTELVEESSKKAEAKIAQESSSKRAGTELEQESIKKQKVDADKETAELQRLIEIIPDKEEVAIDAIHLATKPPSIVDYKIYKEGKKTYYQIIRANGSSKMYIVFSHMLKSFDKEDLETLWKLVKANHGSTGPEEGYERVLWGDLKTMFDPHVEDQVWRNQQDYRVLDWKVYDSCGVHSLRMQHMHIYMLVEKRCPLTPATVTDMLNKKLQCDHFSKMYISFLNFSQNSSRINEVFGSILQLMMLVYKLLLLMLEVNAASTKVTTAQRLRLLKEFLLSDLRRRTAYTAYSDPQGVIYIDQMNKNILMHTGELHKFSDGTLDFVQTALHDIASDIRIEYLPKKNWSRLDKQRARVMILNIDKQLFERRLMRNLEKFVGGREYGNDLRLLDRII